MHRFLDRVRERRQPRAGLLHGVVRAHVRHADRVRRARDSSTTAGSRSSTRAQKAADAAALAGAVFLPENVGNKAYTTAQTHRQRERLHQRLRTASRSPPRSGRLPNQLKVTVAMPTKNPWGAIVGYNNTTIVRSAVAEYQLPQNLGSPQNSYGNDPESAAATQPQFWGNVFGPSSTKGKGDAIQSVGPTRQCDPVPDGERQLPRQRCNERRLRRQRLLLRHRRSRRHDRRAQRAGVRPGVRPRR